MIDEPKALSHEKPSLPIIVSSQEGTSGAVENSGRVNVLNSSLDANISSSPDVADGFEKENKGVHFDYEAEDSSTHVEEVTFSVVDSGYSGIISGKSAEVTGKTSYN